MAQHLLLFDIDGTLLRAGGAGRRALERALANEFGVANPRLEIGIAGRTDRAIASEALESHGIVATEELFARYLDAYILELPECLQESDGAVLEGVRELLEELAGRKDVVLGLITGNMERAARLKLAHFGLEAFFVGGGFGDHHASRDDVARDAARACSEHAGTPAKIWVIGDTPHDVRCARAIGARAIAVAGGFSNEDDLRRAAPDHLLDDLSRPRDFLALLERS